MTQTMLEKMAIAAIETDIADNARPELRKKLISLSLADEVHRMRAALQALREQSEQVAEATYEFLDGYEGRMFGEMIDAVLQEKPEPL